MIMFAGLLDIRRRNLLKSIASGELPRRTFPSPLPTIGDKMQNAPTRAGEGASGGSRCNE
jgi:hypothetical protein